VEDLKLWDDVADEYEDYTYNGELEMHPANKYRSRIVMDFLKDLFENEGRKILDAGCGTGFVSRLILKQGWNCISVDQSPEMIRVSKQKSEVEGLVGDFRQGLVTDLGQFQDGEFEVVLLLGVLPYIEEENEIKVFEECRRVLKKGGYLILANYNELFKMLFNNLGTVKVLNNELVKGNVEFDEKVFEIDENFKTMKMENPLTYNDKLKKFGFTEERQHYYNFHVTPPSLATKDHNEVKGKLELSFHDKWQGIFLAQTFISISKLED
tara:strand:- start:10488 stop:11288 length:801 start_codon:yes stop_codon:yes gene_type:complete